MEKRKILVIEDEEDTANYLITLLQDHGFEAVMARDGQEGLEIARKETPDLITLDISMPEKSGVKALRELQEDTTTSRIPVVLVTGVSEELDSFIKRHKKIKPPEAFISKPIDRKELLETIESILS